jgi:hypothetical protein
MRLLFASLTFAVSSLAVASLFLSAASASAEQRVCVITDEGATACGRVTIPTRDAKKPSQTSQSSGRIKEIDNITFSLKGCRQSEETIKCEFNVMNKGRDTIVQFPVVAWAGELSKIVDSRGTVYRSNSIDIDSQQPDGNGTVGATLVSGVNYIATINFKNIPNRLDSIQVFDISIGNTSKHPQFRNISLSN